MPSTRNSHVATPQLSLADIPSDRVRRDVENLCRKWDVPTPEFLAFFGVDNLVPKLLSSLRDLRVRLDWPAARILLDESPRIGGDDDKNRRRSHGDPRPAWCEADVRAAIAAANASHRTPGGHRTRSQRVSAVELLRSPTEVEADDSSDSGSNPDDTTEPATPQHADRRGSPHLGSRPARDDVPVRTGDATKTTPPSSRASSSLVKRPAGDTEPAQPPKRQRGPKKAAKASRRYTGDPFQPVESTLPPHPSADDPFEVPDSDHDAAPPKPSNRTPWPKSLRRTLKPEGWLNDEAVHGILSILAAAADSDAAAINPLLVTRKNATPARSVKTLLASTPETLILPLHLGNHWTLMIVHNAIRRADFYDSMPTKANHERASEIFSRFAAAYLPGSDDWSIADVPCAEQFNDYDCGIFTVANAAYALAGRGAPTTLAADPWRRAFSLLVDPEPTLQGSFAEFLEGPMLGTAPYVKRTSTDDITAFHELRQAWVEHFEGRVAQLSRFVADLGELGEVEATLGCLIQPPEEEGAEVGTIDTEPGLERDLRNVQKQIELRTQLSRLPDCEAEMDALPPLRERAAQLRAKLAALMARREARVRVEGVIGALGAQKAESKAALARLGGRLNEYRKLFVVVSCED